MDCMLKIVYFHVHTLLLVFTTSIIQPFHPIIQPFHPNLKASNSLIFQYRTHSEQGQWFHDL